LELDFPVERGALSTLFANLLRNAEAAASADAAGAAGAGVGVGVIVRAGEERDQTGRRVLVLAIGDSSRRELSIEAIEGRESGRGLAIVRDLVHEWRGHLVIRPEPSPWVKGVGACFPT
jgi:signal transduction histidine kinase